MINGRVNARGEICLRLTVVGPQTARRDVDAIIDTGFDGVLSLPSILIEELGLPWKRRSMALLADGRETPFDVYEGTIIWDGESHRAAVDQAETAPLIGTALLWGYELAVEMIPEGNVTLRRMTRS